MDPYIYAGSAFLVAAHSKHLAGPMPFWALHAVDMPLMQWLSV